MKWLPEFFVALFFIGVMYACLLVITEYFMACVAR